MPPEFLGPGAAILAALFSGTIGLWLGSRLQLGRFKHERAFDRRVEWYERILQSLQRIRDVIWEINTTLRARKKVTESFGLSKRSESATIRRTDAPLVVLRALSTMSPKRYDERSARLKDLVRDFHQVAAERHYAKPETIQAIRGLGLTALSLERNVPGLKTGRKAGVFWLEQHNDWSKAFQSMSEDLQDELFRHTYLFRLPLRRARRRVDPIPHVPVKRQKGVRGWWLSVLRRKRPVPLVSSDKPANVSTDSSAHLDDEGANAIFEALWATIQSKKICKS
jgi:hypothetical protein